MKVKIVESNCENEIMHGWVTKDVLYNVAHVYDCGDISIIDDEGDVLYMNIGQFIFVEDDVKQPTNNDLLNEFAKAALVGLLSSGSWSYKTISENAFKIAKYMVEEAEKHV